MPVRSPFSRGWVFGVLCSKSIARCSSGSKMRHHRPEQLFARIIKRHKSLLIKLWQIKFRISIRRRDARESSRPGLSLLGRNCAHHRAGLPSMIPHDVIILRDVLFAMAFNARDSCQVPVHCMASLSIHSSLGSPRRTAPFLESLSKNRQIVSSRIEFPRTEFLKCSGKGEATHGCNWTM